MGGNVLRPLEWLGAGNNPRQFKVPVYQRLFAWGKEQFDRLLEDLKNTGNAPHYLGIITVVKKSDDSFVLIDGQQRLTVIAILTRLLGEEELVSKIDERLSYEARPDDTAALKNIWKNGKDWMNADKREMLEQNIARSGLSNGNMKELVLTVWQWLRENGNKKPDVNALRLLVAELPEAYKDDINLQNEYFEKMNSSGKQLEQYEVLKVRMCQNGEDFEKWNAIENFRKAYWPAPPCAAKNEEDEGKGKAISLFEAANNKGPNGNVAKDETPEKWRASLIDFPVFLRHVHALCQVDGNLDINTPLLKLFKDKPKGFLDKMGEYREYLDSRIIHIAVNEGDQEDEQEFAYWLSERKETPLPTVLCTISANEKALFKQLQMTLFALEGTRQDWVLESFRQEGTNVSAEWLVRYLVSKADFNDELKSADAWPDDYLVFGTHPRAQLACLEFFLWALWKSDDEDDRELQDGVFGKLIEEEKKAVEAYVPRAHRSVEHFHPRTDVNSSSAWDENAKHLFGNLALISAGENSKYSNLGVAGKSERITQLVQKQAIESIKLLLMRADCRDTNGSIEDKNWTPEKARDHATKMLCVIKWGIQKWEAQNGN